MEDLFQTEWIYDTDQNNTVRYTLGIRGDNPLVCFGINPSTAAPGKLDNTLRSVAKVALRNGFDSWIMLNLYPLRMTDPNGLPDLMDPVIHQHNLMHIGKIVSQQPMKLWAAWGTLIMKQGYLKNCLKDILGITDMHPCEWFAAGKESVHGHPHHPLYLRANERIRPFDINSYLMKLS